MNVLIIFAHPEPHSLNGFLRDHAVTVLEREGHQVKVSDLYAMKFKASADAEDFPQREPGILHYEKDSGKAYATGTQSADVFAEQEKLLWADAVIFQFPLWWYGMPAILKGWVDRVFARGFAYGRGVHQGTHWGDRFGEGILQGKRSMIVLTVGGRAAQYGPRGVNGSIDDILWPIQHGVMFYPGMSVLPPVVFYEVGKTSTGRAQIYCAELEKRLLSMESTEPIPLRSQNGGDYDEHQTLLEGLEGEQVGLLIHQQDPPYISNIELTRGADFSPLHQARDSRSAQSTGKLPMSIP